MATIQVAAVRCCTVLLRLQCGDRHGFEKSVSVYTSSADISSARFSQHLLPDVSPLWGSKFILICLFFFPLNLLFFVVFLLMNVIKTHPTIKMINPSAVLIFPRTYSTQTTERSTQSTQLLTSGKG